MNNKERNRISEIENILLDNNLDGSSFFTDYDYFDAICGYTEEGNIIYSYTKMIEYLVEKHNMCYDEACEWIDYNTLRIPYMGEIKPIIMYDLIF